MFIDEIIEKKTKEVEGLKKEVSIEELKSRLAVAPDTRDFCGALTEGAGIKIIAEVKKASPSKGTIREDFDPVAVAKIYETNGACAVSVLTERDFFKGSPKYLTKVRAAVRIPVLRKDFIFDPFQIYESRVMGADAVLLIAAIVEKDPLGELIELTKRLGMAPLVEVHTERELASALDAGAAIIGINNRDLRTFDIDLETTRRLAPLVPEDKVIVSESGINSADDIRYLSEAGVRAFLIGEALMRQDDIGRRLREFLSPQAS